MTTTTLTPDDFLVVGLDKIEPAYADFDGQMYAGMMSADHDDRVGLHTMFWLFKPTKQLISNTMVIWLNGGPGCSSFNCGVMMEHSPVTQPLHDAGYCCLDSSEPKLGVNKHTWTRATTMLYVEHPIGTGFSYGHPYPQNEYEASGDLDAFLQNFFAVFQDLHSHKFFVFGESYAGMFVPSISRYIHNANKEALASQDSSRIQVRLAGAALGNGWIDPIIQGPATIDYSWYHGLIDEPTRSAMHIEFKNCLIRKKRPAILNAKEPPPFHPFNVQDDCGIMWGILQAAGNPNAYDITTWDPNVDQITFSSEEFYNSPEVKKALHVTGNALNHEWHGCQAGSGRRRRRRLMEEEEEDLEHPHRRLYMDNDRPLSVTPYIGELLDEGIPVIVYNGDRDMTTNMVGQELCLNGMEWNSKDKWLDAPRGLWLLDGHGYPAGWAKELGNLTFAVVYNSGHMVPYNAPNSAYDLLKRFLKGESFIDEEAPQIRIKPIYGAPTTTADSSDESGSTSTTTTKLSASIVGGDSNITTAATDSGIGDISMVLITLILGFIMGAFFVKRESRQGYRRVPEVDSKEALHH